MNIDNLCKNDSFTNLVLSQQCLSEPYCPPQPVTGIVFFHVVGTEHDVTYRTSGGVCGRQQALVCTTGCFGISNKIISSDAPNGLFVLHTGKQMRVSRAIFQATLTKQSENSALSAKNITICTPWSFQLFPVAR
jgi:hypothetical protein